MGVTTARDGLRWHLIEPRPGDYDWSSFRPMVRAAGETGMQVVWDLCHYGCPDHIDIWSADFPEHFGRYAAAVARFVRDEIADAPFYCPINEISYWAWAGGDMGKINPCERGRGGELKRQLVRATIAAIEAIRFADPRARFITAEPLIHVTTASANGKHKRDAEAYRLSQFEALDLLTGRMEPGLGGREAYLDLVGLNFYPDNQWYLNGPTIYFGHHAYRPLSDMLMEVFDRYRRPIFIAETGAEGAVRASWLHYILSEVSDACRKGTPVEGVCLYPILDYPGWENGRMCEVGLLGEADDTGTRQIHSRLCELVREYASWAQPPIHSVRGGNS
jgi:beta-glucosidase/6-phospho-beta-glucosidase/beta-galactosidase